MLLFSWKVCGPALLLRWSRQSSLTPCAKDRHRDARSATAKILGVIFATNVYQADDKADDARWERPYGPPGKLRKLVARTLRTIGTQNCPLTNHRPQCSAADENRKSDRCANHHSGIKRKTFRLPQILCVDRSRLVSEFEIPLMSR